MRFRNFPILLCALALVSCSDAEVTAPANPCAERLYSPVKFDPKKLEHCVQACIKCDRGAVTTCSTACTLRGAH
jgi:hypothetical protein